MDLSSVWLTNCHFIESMPETEYTLKEKEIIELFGGIKNIIKITLKNKHNLTYLQHHQLSNVLKKSIPKSMSNNNADIHDLHQIDIDDKNDENKKVDDNDIDENDPILLSNLNENCISNICKFLEIKEREIFSVTSRWIRKTCRMKHSSLNHQQIAFSIHRLYHFVNQLCQNCQIKHIQNDDNLSKFIHQCQSLFSWIHVGTAINDKQELIKRKQTICDIICHSGLLPIFSNLLMDQTLINDNPKLIKNILVLFNIISEFDQYVHFVLNANIIENMSMIINIKHESNEFITDILDLLNVLCNGGSSLQSSIPNRVFHANLIEQIILKFGHQSSMKLRFSTIKKGLKLIQQWVDFTECDEKWLYSETILKTIFPQIIDKIKNIINVQYQNKWIYELEKGDDVMIRNNNDPSVFSLFTIEEITQLSDINGTDPSITLLGQYDQSLFNDSNFGPYQQVSVPLYDIKCIVPNLATYTNVYYKILNLLETITELMVSFVNRYGCVCYQDNQYQDWCKKIIIGIKNIFQTSQTQILRFKRSNILLNILYSNWCFFYEFLKDEIETEFSQNGANIFELMNLAKEWTQLTGDSKYIDNLIQLDWFKQALYAIHDHLYLFDYEEYVYFMPILLKNFHKDGRSYLSLCKMLENIEDWNYDQHQDWNYQHNIRYLLYIIKTSILYAFGDVNHVNFPMNEIPSIIRISRAVLLNICIHFNDFKVFRQEVCNVMDDRNQQYLKPMWWCILKTVLIRKQYQTKICQAIIHEMDWFIHEYNIDSSWFTNNMLIDNGDLMTILSKLESTYSFTEDDTISALQNVISIL